MPTPKRSRGPYPSQRYGAAHKAMRKRLAPVVVTGTVRCARCDELIASGDKWQLDHRDDGRGWLGPSHQSCNSRAGWEKMVAAYGNAHDFRDAAGTTSRLWAPKCYSATGSSRFTSVEGSGRRSPRTDPLPLAS